MSAGSATRPGRSNTDERRSLRLGVALLSVAVAVSATLALVAWQLNSDERAPGGVIGPVVLDNSTRGYGLTFPNCSFVRVHWVVTAGSYANFTIGQGVVLFTSSCHTLSRPSNETCPLIPGVCSEYTLPPICFETGTSGNCTFTSTQPLYGVELFSPATQSAGPEPLGDLSVTFWAYYD